jgi:hypothetical protein
VSAHYDGPPLLRSGHAGADLVSRLAVYAGGAAEEAHVGGLFVLLPREAAARSGLGESFELDPVRLAEDQGMLDGFAALLDEGGRRDLWWPGELYLKRDGLGEAISGAITAVNGLVRPGAPEETLAAYDTYVFKYGATSEETEEGLVAATASALTCRAVPGLADALSGLARSEGAPPAAGPDGGGAAFEAASHLARREVELRLEPLVKSLGRRLARDERRLGRYYSALEEQVDARRTRASPEEREDRKAAVRRELERKLGELDSRYSVKVKLEAVCVSRAVLPVMKAPVTLVRRKVERRLFAVWNPALRAVEPLACEACLAPAPSFHLCDAAAHVVCRDCASSADLRRSCPACDAGRR